MSNDTTRDGDKLRAWPMNAFVEPDENAIYFHFLKVAM